MEEKKIIGIRWHGRAGQGTVTAAKMLAEILIDRGKFVQAFPEFGPERRGAPVRAFNRISSEPIYLYGPVEEPDFVIVADPFYVLNPSVKAGTDDNTVFLFNSEKSPEEIKKGQGLVNNKVFVIPASRISLDHIGRDLPNMPMLAAFFSTWGEVSREELIDNVKRILSRYFTEDIVEKNIGALKEAQEVVNG